MFLGGRERVHWELLGCKRTIFPIVVYLDKARVCKSEEQ